MSLSTIIGVSSSSRETATLSAEEWATGTGKAMAQAGWRDMPLSVPRECSGPPFTRSDNEAFLQVENPAPSQFGIPTELSARVETSALPLSRTRPARPGSMRRGQALEGLVTELRCKASISRPTYAISAAHGPVPSMGYCG